MAPRAFTQADRTELLMALQQPNRTAKTFRKTARIVAVQVDEPFTVETSHGTMAAEPGDWLATNHPHDDVTSDLWPISNERMSATYVEVDPLARIGDNQ